LGDLRDGVVKPILPFLKMGIKSFLYEINFIFGVLRENTVEQSVRFSSNCQSNGFEVAVEILEKQISKGTQSAVIITEIVFYASNFIFRKLLQIAVAKDDWQPRNSLSIKRVMALATQRLF
jgi:hypothetical protein